MLPSVCAARFFGCTAMPASSAHQTLCTLILPLARSTDTSATPAASVSSFTMVATPKPRPSRLRCQSDISATMRTSVLHARLPFRQLEPERDRVLRQLLGDLVEEALGRERVVAVADAAPGRQPGAAGHDDVLGELVRDRILRDRRSLHHDPVGARLWIAATCRRPPTPTPRGDARRSACRRHRSRPRCDARSSAGTCRRSDRPRGSRSASPACRPPWRGAPPRRSPPAGCGGRSRRPAYADAA